MMQHVTKHDTKHVTKRELFLGFLVMGLSSFGGVLPWARRVLVEQRKWLTNEEFVEALSLGQILPGPNIVNIAIMVGARFQGRTGAVLAFSGLMFAPLAIVLLLAALYEQYSYVLEVQRALASTAAAAAGLVVAMGIKLVTKQPRSLHAISITALAFTGAGVMKWSLLTVLALLVPLSLVWAWRSGR